MMAVKYLANVGIEAISIPGTDLGSAVGAGEEFALSITNNGTPTVTWQTVIDGAIASITVLLQASLDGSSWSTIDTSTSTTGEIRTITGSYRFIRINNSAVAGGAGDTLTASFTYSLQTTGSGGGTWGSITGTLSSQTDLQTALDAKLDDTDSLRAQSGADVTNATTTMSNLTALSLTLEAAIKYSFKLILFVNESVPAEGLKIDFDGGDATMTNFRAHGLFYDVDLLLSVQTALLATDMAQASFIGDGLIEVSGSFEVNAAGTFIPRYAQNSHTSGLATVRRGSNLIVTRME